MGRLHLIHLQGMSMNGKTTLVTIVRTTCVREDYIWFTCKDCLYMGRQHLIILHCGKTPLLTAVHFIVTVETISHSIAFLLVVNAPAIATMEFVVRTLLVIFCQNEKKRKTLISIVRTFPCNHCPLLEIRSYYSRSPPMN